MLADVVIAEFAKLRRSPVPPATLAGLSLGPLGVALFMWIVREPGRAAQLGLLGTKANLSGLEATWPAFAGVVTMLAGIGGMLLLSFIVAYVFGREFTDGTQKNLLALPIRREWFVLAKLMVAAAWWAALVVAVLAEALVVGLALALPGLSAGVVAAMIGNALVAAAISFLLAPVVAWVTVVGRGYLAPIGFALGMMALGDVFGHTGWSVWFPWSIVPALIGLVGKPVAGLPLGSWVVLVATALAGAAGACAWVRWADAG